MRDQISIYELYIQITFEMALSLYNLMVKNVINSQKERLLTRTYIFSKFYKYVLTKIPQINN